MIVLLRACSCVVLGSAERRALAVGENGSREEAATVLRCGCIPLKH